MSGWGFAFLSLAFVLLFDQRQRINKLTQEVENLHRRFQSMKLAKTSDTPEPATPSPAEPPNVVRPAVQLNPFDFYPATTRRTTKPRAEKRNFERQFGAKLPVWIGGIALALAGFYLVKYSIDMGWLSPAVRTTIGALFGIGLLYAGDKIIHKKDMADSTRIGQALSGAGIAVLYICTYAASNLYDLVPPAIGFAGMAVVTAIAVVLSVRHGAPIALLGLVGGFITPMLINSDQPSPLMLFAYLYLLIAGILILARKQQWWGLGSTAVFAGFIWAIFWVSQSSFAEIDTIWIGLFLLLVSLTAFASTKTSAEAEKTLATAMLGSGAMIGSLVIMGLVSYRASFGLEEWGLFGLLSIASIAMAIFDYKTYNLAPWVALAANILVLLIGQEAEPHLTAYVIALMAALYIVSGSILQWRSSRPLDWAAISAVSAISFYMTAYYKIHAHIGNDNHWAWLALVAAVVASEAALRAFNKMPAEHPSRQPIVTIHAGTTTAFLSFGLAILVDNAYWPLILSLEIATLAWIYAQTQMKPMRIVAGAASAVFICLLLPQMLFILQLAFFSLFEKRLHTGSTPALIDNPLLHLGVPGLLFLISSIYFRKYSDTVLSKTFEVIAMVLVGISAYYTLRHITHPDENILFVKAGFIERGIFTNIMLLAGLGLFYAGRRFSRTTASVGGMVLCMAAVFRITYFDLLIHNPLFSRNQLVGNLPILNGLILTYGLPVVLGIYIAKELTRLGKERAASQLKGFMFCLSFALVSLEVRQLFHGTNLRGHIAENAEIYSYSAAWLLFGLSALFIGTLNKNKNLRIASLVIMILTVLKVFLMDASALTGLYRVFSFLGLGISLLALSWFYSRFVFNKDSTEG